MNSKEDWFIIALADLKNRLEALEKRQDEIDKKEYAAHLLARVTLRVVRVFWWAITGAAVYTAAHWGKVRAMLEGWK